MHALIRVNFPHYNYSLLLQVKRSCGLYIYVSLYETMHALRRDYKHPLVTDVNSLWTKNAHIPHTRAQREKNDESVSFFIVKCKW